MPDRRLAIILSLATVALLPVIGCSESHKKTGSPESERVEIVTSVTELADVVVQTLADDDRPRFVASCVPKLEDLRRAIRSNAKPRVGMETEDRFEIEISLQLLTDDYPRIRERVLQSWSRVRQQLRDRKIDAATLKDESFDHKVGNEYGITTADSVRINVTAGSRKFAILIDHCIQIDGKWRIVGELRLAPDATQNTARRKE